MTVFGSPVWVPFDSESSQSFVSSSFELYANRKLSPLKHKLVVMTLLGKQIICTSVFRGCDILVEGVVLKANLILLEMWDFDVILGMDWLSTHQALVYCFTKKVMFQKPWFSKLEFEGDCRVLPTCVISVLEAKRLLQKGCEAYLAHVIDTSTSKVTLESALVVREFSDEFLEDLPRLPSNKELELLLIFCPDQFLFLYYHIRWLKLSLKSWRRSFKIWWTKVSFDQVYHLGVLRYCLWRRRVEPWDYVLITYNLIK